MTSSETPRRASVLSTAFNLINCAIGAGVLGVPFAVRSMGAVLGALSLCLVMAISVLTLNVLTRAARAYGASSYQELVRKSMGWFAAHVVSLTLVAYVFGGCVAYTIVCADSFGEFNQRAFGSGSIAANRSVIVLFTSTCVMLPLSLLRSMERMAFASSFSVLALVYTSVVVVAEGLDQPAQLGCGEESLGRQLLPPHQSTATRLERDEPGAAQGSDGPARHRVEERLWPQVGRALCVAGQCP